MAALLPAAAAAGTAAAGTAAAAPLAAAAIPAFEGLGMLGAAAAPAAAGAGLGAAGAGLGAAGAGAGSAMPWLAMNGPAGIAGALPQATSVLPMGGGFMAQLPAAGGLSPITGAPALPLGQQVGSVLKPAMQGLRAGNTAAKLMQPQQQGQLAPPRPFQGQPQQVAQPSPNPVQIALAKRYAQRQRKQRGM